MSWERAAFSLGVKLLHKEPGAKIKSGISGLRSWLRLRKPDFEVYPFRSIFQGINAYLRK